MKEKDLKRIGITAYLIQSGISLDSFLPLVLNQFNFGLPSTLHELIPYAPKMSPDALKYEYSGAGVAFAVYVGALVTSVYKSHNKKKTR